MSAVSPVSLFAVSPDYKVLKVSVGHLVSDVMVSVENPVFKDHAAIWAYQACKAQSALLAFVIQVSVCQSFPLRFDLKLYKRK